MAVVAFSGSRKVADWDAAEIEIEKILQPLPRGTIVVTGGQFGIDTLAIKTAYAMGFPTLLVIPAAPFNGTTRGYASWTEDALVPSGSDNAAAYRARNQRMVDLCDILYALPEGPEQDHPRSGTWMTIRMAAEAEKMGNVIPLSALSDQGS